MRFPSVLAALSLSLLLVAKTAAAEPNAEQPRIGPAVIDASKYPNLQAAFDALPQAGGLVKLPPGNFELTEPLVLSRENTRIEGSGAATHLINKNESGKPALILRPFGPNQDPPPRKWRAWRVQVADFRISGNPKSGDGLLALHVEELYVHGMSIDHNGRHGINMVTCREDARVSDSIITYNGQAGLYAVGAHDTVVNGNHFEENQDAVRFIDGFNLCMNGNNLDDHLRHGVVIENTYGSVLSGNMIEECKGTAVILERDCYGITISANVIAHNFGGGVDLRDAWGCTVSANTFVVVAPHALSIGPQSGRITVTGNQFTNNWIGGKTKNYKCEATGIRLAGTSDIVISGNGFAGLDAEAVAADDKCRRIVIVANVIVDVQRGDAPRKPPLDVAAAKESIVEQNIVTKQTEPKPAK